MSEEDRLKLENELLLTKSKAQMINLYLDLQQKVEQLEKENQKLKEDNIFLKTNLTKLSSKYIKNDLLNILNKGSDKECGKN